MRCLWLLLCSNDRKVVVTGAIRQISTNGLEINMSTLGPSEQEDRERHSLCLKVSLPDVEIIIPTHFNWGKVNHRSHVIVGC